jgi:hypothetical protein
MINSHLFFKFGAYKMIKFLFLPIFLLGFVLFPSHLKSDTPTNGVDILNISYKKGLKLAKKEGKYLMILVASAHCDVCVRSEAVFNDSQIAQLYKDKFVVIKMDPEKITNNVRLNNWGIAKIPSVLIFKKKKMIYHSVGEQTKDSLLSHLSRIK